MVSWSYDMTSNIRPSSVSNAIVKMLVPSKQRQVDELLLDINVVCWPVTRDTHSVLFLESSGHDSKICNTLTDIGGRLDVESINHLQQ